MIKEISKLPKINYDPFTNKLNPNPGLVVWRSRQPFWEGYNQQVGNQLVGLELKKYISLDGEFQERIISLVP